MARKPAGSKKNSAKKSAKRASKGPVRDPKAGTGPKRDPKTGRVSGGNPGNSGGKPGRSGRPSNDFRTWCREVIDDPRVRNAATMKLVMPFDPGWASAFKAVAAYGHGLPEQKLDITTDELRGRVRATAELLARELPADVFDRIEPQLAAIWNGADAQAELEEAAGSGSEETHTKVGNLPEGGET